MAKSNRAEMIFYLVAAIGILSVIPPKVNEAQPTRERFIMPVVDVSDTIKQIQVKTKETELKSMEVARELRKDVARLNKILASKERLPEIKYRHVVGIIDGEIVPLPGEEYHNYFIVDIDSICQQMSCSDTVVIIEQAKPEKKKNFWQRLTKIFRKHEK